VRWELKNEFAVIWGVSAILLVIAGLTELQIPRVVLGLPCILLFPGYVLVAALFPGKKGLSGAERLALSLGLSVVIVTLGGLILNYGLGIYPVTVFGYLFLFITCLSVLGWHRRRRLPAEERFCIVLDLDPKSRISSRADRVLVLALAGALLFASGSLAYVLSAPAVGERFTEFYLLDTSGRAENYPREVRPGEACRLILGIANHEHRDAVYRVKCLVNGHLEWRLGPLRLAHGERVERLVSFTSRSEPGEMQVVFYLYRDGETEHLRALHLWVKVVEAESEDGL
jgi:uncharacterized membrane protein